MTAALRVFIGNPYFGAGNFGDDLTIAGFLREAARHTDVEFSACSASDRTVLARRFPEVRWLADSPRTRFEALRDSAAWLSVGDTPFQLDSGPWLLEHNEAERQRCAALGKPMYWLGAGCEGAGAAADPRGAALLAAAERVWARDDFSAQLMQPFVRENRLTLGADLAHLCFDDAAAERQSDGGDIIAIVAAFERPEQFDLAELARYLERRSPRTTRWLVQETRALRYAERWLFAQLGERARSQTELMELDYNGWNIADYLAAFGSPAVTLTSRYHAALVAAWHGSRITLLARSGKIQGMADELGLVHAPLNVADAYEAAAALARGVPAPLLYALRARARAACAEFFAALQQPRSKADAHGMAVAASYPLPRDALRATVYAQLPDRLHAAQSVVLPCTITNLGPSRYATLPPNPVYVCYRWIDAAGAPQFPWTWVHTSLPRPLDPGESVTLDAAITAPREEGTYTLALTLLHADVAWFDDVDAAYGVRGRVVITRALGQDGDIAFFDLTPDERRALTRDALATRTPLHARWSSMSTSPARWEERAAAAGAWLRGAGTVVDLGCGAMPLEHYLEPGQRYVPVDLAARDERTIVLDLEADPLPAIRADACALLGVLAYLFDPAAFLRKMALAYPRAVVSYNVRPDQSERLALGWVNHYDYDGLLAAFAAAGFGVHEVRDLGGEQFLFDLRYESANTR